MIKRLVLLGAVGVLTTSIPNALAATAKQVQYSPAPDLSTLVKLVAQASGHRAHLVKIFAGPDGLVGLVVSGQKAGTPRRKEIVAWTTDSAKVLFVGAAFDESGHELTHAAAQRFAQTVSASTHSVNARPKGPSQTLAKHGSLTLGSAALWKRVTKAPGVTLVGSASAPKHTLYVFADPQCHFCEGLYSEIEHHLTAFNTYGVSVRWIPVAALSHDSRGPAAAVLRDGKSALMQIDLGRSLNDTNAKRIAEIEHNTSLMQRDGTQQATPTLVFQVRGETKTIVGQPTPKGLHYLLEMIGHRRSSSPDKGDGTRGNGGHAGNGAPSQSHHS